MRATLSSQPERARKKAEYENVIRAFKSVHFYDPAFSKSPMALEAVGDLYAEMGRRFENDEYYRSAVQAYRYVISQYPGSSFARDALFTIAEIYRSDLQESTEARKTYREFLETYPKSAQTADAREKLKQLEQQRSGETKEPSPAGSEHRRQSNFPEVTGVRRWVGPNYSRIVINVEGEVKFESSRVPNPDRIVLDLMDARLSSSLVGKTFPVEDGFLRQVRIGQYRPTVTRVVLDVEKVEDYSVFTLPNPFRLIIDVNGPPLVAEKGAASKPSEAKPNKAAEPAGSNETPTLAASKKPEASMKEPPGKVEIGRLSKPERDEGEVGAATEPNATTERRETGALKSPGTPEKLPRQTATSSRGSEETANPIKPPPPTEAGSRTLTRALGLKIGRIVIDPGHGGHDTGTIGPTGLREKDVVLDVGLRLKKLLEEKTGAEVIMTRSDDTFIPLEERTAIANEKNADLFISIHANASRDRSARGIETYFLNFTSNPDALEVAARENATSQESVHQLQDLIKKIALTEKIEESQEFATQVQREVSTRLKKLTGAQKDRGVKKAPFVVLIGANMPSILAEISFLTNPRDERLLRKPEHREKIAEALYTGIAHYVSSLGGVKVARQETTPSAVERLPESTPSSSSNF